MADLQALALVARLFGRLLVREVDLPLLGQLRRADTAAALAGLGIALPDGPGDEALVEALKAEYCACFLAGGEQVPLAQSLYEQGAYEGECARALRELAREAGLEFDREGARGAPVDHLGCILLLWAAVACDRPEARDYLAARHLGWAEAPLRRLAVRPGFYGQVAGGTRALLEQLRSP